MTSPPEPAPVSSLRNLGPATDAGFARAGVHTADELRALGADAAYLRLLQSGARPHFIGYYVLHMALQNRPWNDCKGAEKLALRRRYDTLKAIGHDKGRSELETALDLIGVVERKRAAAPSPEKRPQPTSSSAEK